MRTTSSILVVAAAAAGVGCGSIDTHIDANPHLQNEIVGWRTYAWMATPEGGDPMVQNDIVRARVQDAVDREMARLGYVQDAQDPDFRIGWAAAVEEKIEYGWGSDYYGYGWGGWYDDYAPEYAYEYSEGTLILDFVDGDSNQLAWRGVAEGRLHGTGANMPSNAEIKEAVHEILEEYPLRGQR